MKTALSSRSLPSSSGLPGGTNCGRNAKKKRVSFGLSKLSKMADAITCQADFLSPGRWSTTRGVLSRHDAHAMKSRYPTPRNLTTSNATPLARSSAAVPVTAAVRCGTIPSVQPNAATTLALAPRDNPAEMVYRAPVPGVTTMINAVSMNAMLNRRSSRPFGRGQYHASVTHLALGLRALDRGVRTPLRPRRPDRERIDGAKGD